MSKEVIHFTFEGMDHCGKTTLIQNLESDIRLRTKYLNSYHFGVTTNCYKPKQKKYVEKLDHLSNVNTFIRSNFIGRQITIKEIHSDWRMSVNRIKNNEDFIVANLIDRGLISTFIYGWLPSINFPTKSSINAIETELLKFISYTFEYIESNCCIDNKDEIYKEYGGMKKFISTVLGSDITFLLETDDKFSMKNMSKSKKKENLTDSFEEPTFQKTIRKYYKLFCDLIKEKSKSGTPEYYLIGRVLMLPTGTLSTKGKWLFAPKNVICSHVETQLNQAIYEQTKFYPIEQSNKGPVLYKWILTNSLQENNKDEEEEDLIEVEPVDNRNYLKLISLLPIFEPITYDPVNDWWVCKFKPKVVLFDQDNKSKPGRYTQAYSKDPKGAAKEIYKAASESRVILFNNEFIIIDESDSYTTLNFTDTDAKATRITYEERLEQLKAERNPEED